MALEQAPIGRPSDEFVNFDEGLNMKAVEPEAAEASPGDPAARSSTAKAGFAEVSEEHQHGGEVLAQMEAIHPDLIRSLPACEVLRSCGHALRQYSAHVGNVQDLFKKSRQTRSISEFWSHSWQGSAWKKILTLLFLKNGLAATILSTFAAFIGCALTCLEFLPPFGIVPLWSTTLGVLTFLSTLIFWRSSEEIFLDIGCIDQSSKGTKAKGLLSLGGIMKACNSLLLLWDPSFDQKLWCVFEVAAFLKSRAQKGRSFRGTLIVWPIILGPLALSVFIWSSFFMVPAVILFASQTPGALAFSFNAIGAFSLLYPATSTFRAYWHEMEAFRWRLQSFSLNQTQCHCCTQGHNSKRTFCDREAIRCCIESWFGSEHAFEEACRLSIATSITESLGPHILPYKLYLVSSCPIFWGFIDLGMSQWISDRVPDGKAWAPYYMLCGLAFHLGVGLILVSFLAFLTKKAHRPMQQWWQDILLNISLVLCTFVLFIMLILASGYIASSNLQLAYFDNGFHPWIFGIFQICLFVSLGHLCWHLRALTWWRRRREADNPFDLPRGHSERTT